MALNAVAVAGAAATTAGLAYLDAKFHVRKDLRVILGRRRQIKYLEQALKADRLSPYYLVEEVVRQRPDEEAIWSRAGCYTWKAFYDRVNQFAQWFLAQGVKQKDLVAIFMGNSPEFVMVWVALLAIGAAPAMINHNLASQPLVHCLKVSTAKLMLVDVAPATEKNVIDIQPDLDAMGVRAVRLDDVRADIFSLEPVRPGDEHRAGTKPNWPFGLFYTSGTTGLPKACLFPIAAGFYNGVGSMAGTNHVDRPGERYYDCMPYYHGTGGLSMMTQIMNGTTLCVSPKFSVSRFWDEVRESRATYFVYVGETLRYLLAAPESPRDKEHNVHTIYGNGLRPDVWKRFRDRFGIQRIHEFFNSTEGMFPLDNPCGGDFFAHSVGHHGLINRWRYHNSYVPVAIDTETGEIARHPKTGFAYRVPYEEGGEILIRMPGDRPFGGYFNNPEATEKKYVRDVFAKGDWFYRTGDALRRDSDGRWYFLDRLGDTFRWKGENVSTAEVGEVLGKFPGIVEANVYGVQLPGHDGRAGAAAIYIEPEKRASFDYAGLLAHARQHLPKYAVPIFLRHMAAISASHNNKQNKMPLKQEGVDPDKVKAGDDIWWIEGLGKGKTYVPFTREDWDSISAGKAKL
ncbi:fatty acid transporter [Magnaporthiopsis poae ATCC 64411]|uniref:Very long-chain fatty acid transport protein n=1 Tax=Magnaporthiopsis poae (strain ATCC 64411 / 73-15) TaxID=644358 RepID=A0A0C4E6Q2_MAGP6|nr:fatty acid transporter [Magnaporthiopsis poae ATCC 64411]